jgi:hypothetical protein
VVLIKYNKILDEKSVLVVLVIVEVEVEREELEEQAEDEDEDDDDKATLANSAPVVQNTLNYSR